MMWGKVGETLTILKLSFLSLSAAVYTSQAQVCTQNGSSPLSTLRSKKAGAAT